MTRREELLREIAHLEKQIDHLEDERSEIQSKIDWFIRIIKTDEQELEDILDNISECDCCGECFDSSTSNNECICEDCKPKHNEDEFDR